MLLEGLGIEPGDVKALQFRFHDNVVPGDELVARGEITSVRTTDGGTQVDCSFRLDLEGGHPRLTGTATIEVPRA